MSQTLRNDDNSEIEISIPSGSEKIQVNISDTLSEVLFAVTADEARRIATALNEAATRLASSN